MPDDCTINVCGIVDGTSVDGPGLRTSIYVAGCRHRCPGCHNAHTWPFDAGDPMSLDELFKRVVDNDIDVTFSGGDPIYSAAKLLPLARRIKERGYNIWMYTGFTYEQLMAFDNSDVADLLEYVDVLVDGPYIEALRDTDLIFRGSSNQRLIDLDKTRKEHKIVLFQTNYRL